MIDGEGIDGWLSCFGGLNFQLCATNVEEREVEGGEEEDVVVEEEEGEEGCSQRSSDLPMTASVDPEIHKNLWKGRDKIRIKFVSDHTELDYTDSIYLRDEKSLSAVTVCAVHWERLQLWRTTSWTEADRGRERGGAGDLVKFFFISSSLDWSFPERQLFPSHVSSHISSASSLVCPIIRLLITNKATPAVIHYSNLSGMSYRRQCLNQ